MSSTAWLLSYKGDDHSLFTVHTLLHIGSGVALGAAAHALDLDAPAAAFMALAAILGWELFEYWHAPAFGYWTVMNAGNTAVDIATGLWPFMAMTREVAWDTAPWTFALVVPGALLGRAVRCPPYATDRPRVKYNRKDQGVLMSLYRVRASRYPTYLKGRNNFDDARFPLDPYMAPSAAHRALAAASAAGTLMAAFVPELAVPCLASLTFGFALGGPTVADASTYDRWYLNHPLLRLVHARRLRL